MQTQLFETRSATSSNLNIKINKAQADSPHKDVQKQKLAFQSPNSSPKNETNLLVSFRHKKGELSVSPRRNRQSDFSNNEQVDGERCDSVGPSNDSTVHDEAVSRYQCIANLTQQENSNLKQQNKYLLDKLRKMQDRQSRVKKLYQKAKQYKLLWQQAQLQIEVLKDQCHVYKQQAEQMKKIILNDVCRLKQKVLYTEIAQSQLQDYEQEFHLGKQQNVNSHESTEDRSNKLSSQSSLSKYIKDYPDSI